MPKRKNKLQGYDTLVSTFVLLSNLSEKEVLDRLNKMDRYYNNLIARGMYADDLMYKALDKSNTRIQANMK